MALDVDSEAWESGNMIDPVEIEVDNLLQSNQDQAFTALEIMEFLKDEQPQVFPQKLLSSSEHAEWACLSLVVSRIEKMAWYDHLEMRSIDGDLYYSYSSEGHYPIADIEYEIPSRINEVESKIGDEVDGLEERINYLENQVQEELNGF